MPKSISPSHLDTILWLRQITISSESSLERLFELSFTSEPERISILKCEIAAQLEEIKAFESMINLLRNHLAKPIYHAAAISMPHQVRDLLETAEALLPTGKPYGELLPYIGESLLNLDDGVDLIINVAPSGCMVSTMGGILLPIVKDHSSNRNGHMQTLFSQNGEIDEEAIVFALLKRMEPLGYYR